MEFLLVLAILCAVVFIVTGPLRRPAARGEGRYADRAAAPRPSPANGGARGTPAPGSAIDEFERESELAELEAAREAKYREIRDSQLDYDTGKLSAEDFDALDTGLRSEALDILQRIDRLRAPAAPERADPPLGGLD